MSEENVKTLGAFYEAYNRRGEIDDVLQYLDPEVVCRPGVRPPDDSNEEYVGREAYREFWVSIVIGPWETVVVEPKEVVEAEDGRVLSVDLWHFLGRDGIEIETELPTLFTFRGRLIARIDGYPEVPLTQGIRLAAAWYEQVASARSG